MQELKGYVTDIIYRNDVNFYTVFEVETEDGTVTCTGSLTEISIGENFAMQGEYRVHPTYGEQFAVDSFRIIAPEGAQQIERYLASGAVKGIGQALARRIVKKFGGTSVENKERIFHVAKRCVEEYNKGNDVVVVLSAMGKYTDELYLWLTAYWR